MNILFIDSSKTWGGGGVWLLRICQGLLSRGHVLTVACSPGSALAGRIGRSGAVTVPLVMAGDFNLHTVYRLRRLMTTARVDIVCTNMEKELRLGGLAAASLGIPLVVSREVDLPLKDKWINRMFYTSLASGIMVNSYATCNTMLISAPWLARQQCRIVWKGIDVDLYRGVAPADLRREFHLAPGDRIAGFVGRLDEQKGIPTLLSAMKIAAQHAPALKLILAGEGNLRPVIEAFRTENHLEDHIHVSGFREDVPAFLNAIDFLVMPSYWEGFGYTAVEAMAAGKPVIGTCVSSLPEIIEHRRTGVLIPPRSPEALADAMLLLDGDARLRKEMGEAGFNRARETFPASAMIERTEQFFLDVIERRRKKRAPPSA